MKTNKGPPKSPGWYKVAGGLKWWDGRYWSATVAKGTDASQAAKCAKSRMPYCEQHATEWAALPRRSNGV